MQVLREISEIEMQGSGKFISWILYVSAGPREAVPRIPPSFFREFISHMPVEPPQQRLYSYLYAK
jgi:hypothetical protein